MSQLKKKLGQAIRRLRKKLGYSQEGFADYCKVHRTYMGSVERGERNLSLDSTEKIAKALGMKVSELFEEAEGET